MLKTVRWVLSAALVLASLATQAFAVPCRTNTGSFERWNRIVCSIE